MPAPGWWRGIEVRNAGSGTLTHAQVAYSGYYQSVGLLKTGSGDLTLNSVGVRDVGGDGVRVQNNTGTVSIVNSAFSENTTGLRLSNSGNVTATASTFPAMPNTGF